MWKYMRLDCKHAIALDVPEVEAAQIIQWVEEIFN
jgi:hypothetical protein